MKRAATSIVPNLPSKHIKTAIMKADGTRDVLSEFRPIHTQQEHKFPKSMSDYTSDRSVLKFFSRSKDASVRILSNFSEHPVSVSGFSYATGEHAFQSEKFLRLAKGATAERSIVLTAQSDKVKVAEGPLEAKRCGGKSEAKGLLLTIEEQGKWGKGFMIVQKEICNYKLNNYPECRALLEQHPTHYLLHQENREGDPGWGGRIKDGALVGKNKLGVVWTNACQQLAGWLATDCLFKNSGAATKSRVVSTTNSNSMRSIKTAH